MLQWFFSSVEANHNNWLLFHFFSANFPERKKHFHWEKRISDDNWKWGWNCAAVAQKSVNTRQSWCLSFNVREFFDEPYPFGGDVFARKAEKRDNQEIVDLGWKNALHSFDAIQCLSCALVLFTFVCRSTKPLLSNESSLVVQSSFLSKSTDARVLYRHEKLKELFLYCA